MRPARRRREAWPAQFERNAPYSATPDNRPAILECGALPLTRDPRSQMSFGERCALEGVLAQVRPRMAIEIGTAEGGSLRRIASYSEAVHSIDVDHGPVGDVPANVELHTGGSREMLPPLLSSIARAGDQLDFVLVDGDHSYEGVKRDLELLLGSPCAARAVILVHDTMNAEVRAGVESVRCERYPGVVYYELDFVPGYVYRKGIARNTAWGGLGLILTDRERCGQYADSPRQDLYHEPFTALQTPAPAPSPRRRDDATEPAAQPGSPAACAMLIALAAPSGAQGFSKAIWGPPYVNGHNQFPIYKQLGVKIIEADLTGPTSRPSGRRTLPTPRDPAYLWPEELQQTVSLAKTLPHAGDAADHRRASVGQRRPSVELGAATVGLRNVCRDGGEALPERAPVDGLGRAKPASQLPARDPRPAQRQRLDAAQKVAPHNYARILDAAYGSLKRVSKRNMVIGGSTYTTGDIDTQQWIENLRPAQRKAAADGHLRAQPVHRPGPELLRAAVGPRLCEVLRPA